MARGAVLLSTSGWLIGTVIGLREETPKARTLGLDVPGWMGNDAGQHLDVRLTAPDGYQAARSYSVATAGGGQALEISVDEIDDGEVSPYLVHGLSPGDKVEVRGPLGRWFVWRPTQTEPVQLIGGGSGVAPLAGACCARTKAAGEHGPDAAALLGALPGGGVLPRGARATRGIRVRPHRLRLHARDAARLADAARRGSARSSCAELTIPADQTPTVYVCGPTSFVEAVADWLVELGHDAANIRTERFGGK